VVSFLALALGYSLTTLWLEYRRKPIVPKSKESEEMTATLRTVAQQERHALDEGREFLAMEAKYLKEAVPEMEVEAVEYAGKTIFVAASQPYHISDAVGMCLLTLELEMVWDEKGRRIPKVEAYYNLLTDTASRSYPCRVPINGLNLGTRWGILERAAIQAKDRLRHQQV